MQGRRNLKKTRGKARGRKTTSTRGGALSHIPPFIPTVTSNHVFRFLNGANNGVFTITRANLLNLLLVTPTAISSVRLLEAVRLKAVEIWSQPSQLGSANSSVTLEWLGQFGPSTVVSDIPVGVTPGHIRSSPPSDASERWWSMSGFNETDNLFTLSLPINCVIDVSLEMRFVEQESPTFADIPAGATVGQLYGYYLDGITSGKLAPTGLTVLP
jgi:hypothetical protein